MTLALFVAQTYVVQTHVHLVPGQSSARSVRLHPAQTPSNPLENQLACPFCQDFALVGHYIGPAPLLLAPPNLVLIATRLPPLILDQANRPRPAWYGRAPPPA